MKALVKKIENGIMTVIIGKVIDSSKVLYTYYQYTPGCGNDRIDVLGEIEGEEKQIILPLKWDGKVCEDESILGWNGRKHFLFDATTPEEVVEIINKENPFAFNDFSSLSDRSFNDLCNICRQ